MKNLFLFIFCFIYFSQLWADNFDRTINWETRQNIVSDKKNFSWPDFIGSSRNSKDILPVYIENIKVEAPVSNIEVTVLRLTLIENVPLEKISEISEKIETEYNMFRSGGDQYLQVEMIPFVKKDGQIYRVDSFCIKTQSEEKTLKSVKTVREWTQNSVLASGNWVKIKTTEQGVYKIKYSDLQKWGFSTPSSVKVFGNGGYMLPTMNSGAFYDDLQQIAVWQGKDGDGNNCLFFYSTGTVKWTYSSSLKMFVHQQNYFTDNTFYYLTDSGDDLFVQEENQPTQSAGKEVAEYDYYSRHESDESNLLESGASWYGDEHSTGDSISFSFQVPDRIETDTFKIYTETLGRSSSLSTLKIYLNSKLAGSISYSAVKTTDAEADYGKTGTFRKDKILTGTTISVGTLYSASNSSSEAWIDYIDVNSRCNLNLEEAQLLFRDQRSVEEGSVTEYTLSQANSNVKIWDVTDYIKPESIPTELSGTSLKFKVETGELREFVAFDPTGDISVPEKVEDVKIQNLHADPVPNFLIITNPLFSEQAEELAAFHRENDGMSVRVYTTEQIYNEFSGGQPDAAGIRNFIRMCYEKSSGDDSLKYVLLLGDGSFDNKDIRGKGYNLIPTYQSEESLSPTSSFVSDDFFVLLDSDEGGSTGLVDLGIGRIPARTTDEAEAVITKIKNYVSEEALGNWRNKLCFIADDGNTADGYTNQHAEQSETIADLINQNYPAFYTDKIYLDAYQRESSSGTISYPEVNDAINDRVEEGVLILNYIGHANEKYLADEQILDISTIDSWTNYKNLPIFVTATCEFSRFDADDLSAGEHILFNENGGGIGLFSTTRLVYSGANSNLTKSFYNHVFEKDASGENLRMGDVMRLAKINSNTGNNKRNFTLLADPALRLAYPEFNIKTETINGNDAESYTETISALNKVTVTGSVTDQAGNRITDFNGTVIPVVYDKSAEVETLGNAGQSTMTFTTQSNVIYKGNVSVKSGSFSFSFIVPKDISYSIGNGKIIYYADNGETDANGAFTDFLIGGSSGTTIDDTKGPDITMYMNDDSFRSGDKVGASPILIAELYDESGINTVGTGIGHDITAVIDSNYSNILVLNDYYEADTDSYTNGKIVYPVDGLEPGKHTLTLKVWDVVNNSSEKTIDFIITSDFRITKINCYPNPATEYIWVSFTHNLPDELFSATIEIFDRSGKRVAVDERQISSDGAESVPFKWNFSDSNTILSSGMYLVRVTVKTTEGQTTAKTGKFIFLKN